MDTLEYLSLQAPSEVARLLIRYIHHLWKKKKKKWCFDIVFCIEAACLLMYCFWARPLQLKRLFIKCWHWCGCHWSITVWLRNVFVALCKEVWYSPSQDLSSSVFSFRELSVIAAAYHTIVRQICLNIHTCSDKENHIYFLGKPSK